jgi:hypothetical protein
VAADELKKVSGGSAGLRVTAGWTRGHDDALAELGALQPGSSCVFVHGDGARVLLAVSAPFVYALTARSESAPTVPAEERCVAPCWRCGPGMVKMVVVLALPVRTGSRKG